MMLSAIFCLTACFLIGFQGAASACSQESECQRNAVCVDIGDRDGACLCVWGYKNVNGKCVATASRDRTDRNDGDSSETSSSKSTRTSAPRRIPKTTTRSRSRKEDAVSNEQKVTLRTKSSSSESKRRTTTSAPVEQDRETPDPDSSIRQRFISNESLTEAVPCKNLKDGDVCYNNGECFEQDEWHSWCMCQPAFSGPRCQVKKPAGAGGDKRASDVSILDDSRFLSPRSEDASTWGRHLVADIDECALLCQKAGQSCHSFNYGQVNDRNVCEMLAPRLSDDNPLLKTWVVPRNGWKFVCCF